MPLEGGQGCDPMISPPDLISLDAHRTLWHDRLSCSGPKTEYSAWRDNRCWTWSCEQPFVSCDIDAGRGWPHRYKRRRNDLVGCDGESKSDYDMSGEIWRFFASTIPMAAEE